MDKKDKETIEEAVVHHVHHKGEIGDEYRREITITGATATIGLSSNNPKENMDLLANKAVELFKRVKELDRNE